MERQCSSGGGMKTFLSTASTLGDCWPLHRHHGVTQECTLQRCQAAPAKHCTRALVQTLMGAGDDQAAPGAARHQAPAEVCLAGCDHDTADARLAGLAQAHGDDPGRADVAAALAHLR